MDLQDRNIIVTGGTGALGTAVVAALIEEGAHCRVPYRKDEEAEAFPFKDKVALVAHCELSEEADVARLFEGVGELWASINIAGGFAMKKIGETGKAELMQMLDMNLLSCALCCAAAVRTFGTTGGRIVNVSARPAIEPRLGAGMSAYVASKAAVAALTQAIAAEVAGQNILVNAVAPSIIDTPANRAAMPKANHDAWPKPAEIAATICFLASPENKVTSGAVVPVYGRA
jgi:NAD(P)-dependent dehydrogenase (short-subunit alcohol dehydrogenase family)